MQKEMKRRTGVAALAAVTAVSAGLIGPARKADASIRRSGGEPTVPALTTVKTPPLVGRVKIERDRTLEPTGPEPDTEEATVVLRLTGVEAKRLRSMLHESVTNDLDLLEDTLYHDDLVDSEAVARVALAIRLDVAIGEPEHVA